MAYGAIDLHSTQSQVRIVTDAGEIVDRRIATTRDQFARLFPPDPPMRVLLEADRARVGRTVPRSRGTRGHRRGPELCADVWPPHAPDQDRPAGCGRAAGCSATGRPTGPRRHSAPSGATCTCGGSWCAPGVAPSACCGRCGAVKDCGCRVGWPRRCRRGSPRSPSPVRSASPGEDCLNGREPPRSSRVLDRPLHIRSRGWWRLQLTSGYRPGSRSARYTRQPLGGSSSMTSSNTFSDGAMRVTSTIRTQL